MSAVIFFTPDRGQTAIEPILGGSSLISQNSLAANFSLGSETRFFRNSGTVEVLWPGGVRNRLYNVEAGEKIYFPEIPVSFDDSDRSPREYVI
ncbi:MAG: ASPIC/UnbV domain-containing protein [Hormoscilla sp. GUM202]|nr:ASPIC/UnbV domain-containing protein [Hormoscilla sp. GUM202]